MEVVYKKEKSVLEQIDEAIVNASAYNKKIEKIVLNKEEFDSVCYQLFLTGEYEREYKGVRIELDEKYRDTENTTSQNPIFVENDSCKEDEDKWSYDFLGLFRTKDGINWELAP